MDRPVPQLHAWRQRRGQLLEHRHRVPTGRDRLHGASARAREIGSGSIPASRALALGVRWTRWGRVPYVGGRPEQALEGPRREAIFKASGLEYLWRCVVTAIACAFIIPIPWMIRWMMRWQVSQIELVERGA